MVRFFMSEPAWKIFLLCISPIILGGVLFHMTESITAFQIVVMFVYFVELSWIYSVCVFVTRTYSTQISVPINLQYLALLYLLIYTALFSLDILPNKNLYILSYIAIAANIYCVYFVSRILVMAELERKVTFSDYIGTFIHIYVFFIGVWWLQPRINRLHQLNS
jgi:hypothetical protein